MPKSITDTLAWKVAETLVDGAEDLRRRSFTGERCIALAHDGPFTAKNGLEDDDDRVTYAKDAISDILTALYGPAGYFNSYGRESNETAEAAARSLLDSALESWQGDAEDYTVDDDRDERVGDDGSNIVTP